MTACVPCVGTDAKYCAGGPCLTALQVRVAVTGGGGAELVEALEADAREYRPLYDPLLVHRGLRAAWRLHADGSARRPRYDGGSGDNAL